MAWLAYHFTVQPSEPGSEILAALLADMGFDSFDYGETGFTGYIREEEAKNIRLDDLSFPDFTFRFAVETLPEKNWNEEWEKNFTPVVIDDLLTIRAPFHSPATGTKMEIVIMPKMSFGTGHHQTTRQMCRTMFARDFREKRVLDMGCGTGILAILAVKLGAADVLAVDIDDWCVENSRENAEMNSCPGIQIEKGGIERIVKEAPFDIILANINRNVLLSQMSVYSEKLKSGGKLLLSGFFVTDVHDLSRACEREGMKMISRSNEEEWAMLTLVKE
jgi:ribosomal protein L11 methyltransferase